MYWNSYSASYRSLVSGSTLLGVYFVIGIVSGIRCLLAEEANIRKPPVPPITVAASCVGDFIDYSNWFISIASNGSSEVTVLVRGGEIEAWSMELTQDQMKSLRELTRETRYFKLKGAEFGRLASDVPVCSLAITIGNNTKVVRIQDIRGPRELKELNDQKGIEEYPEAVRAMRVFEEVRSLIDDTRAYDPRPYWMQVRTK